MTQQEIFTQASSIYLDCQQKIRELYNVEAKENKLDEKTLLTDFDLLLQISLLYLSVSDHNILNIELKFIKLLTIEDDILTDYNKMNNKALSWDNLKDTYLSEKDFVSFIDETYSSFSKEINEFILFISSIDAITLKNYYAFFETQIKEIMRLFIAIDGDMSVNEIKEIKIILDKIFLKKYQSSKLIFEASNSFKL